MASAGEPAGTDELMELVGVDEVAAASEVLLGGQATGRKADGSRIFIPYWWTARGDMPAGRGIPAKPGKPNGKKNGKFLAAASMALLVGERRGLVCCSKLKLCLLNSDEVGVCGGVNRGVATSHTAAKP